MRLRWWGTTQIWQQQYSMLDLIWLLSKAWQQKCFFLGGGSNQTKHDIAVYGYTSKHLDDQYLVAVLDPSPNSHSWIAKDWLVPFNTSKTILITFHHPQADYKPVPILTSGQNHKEAPGLEFLGVKLTLHLKQNVYIHVIVQEAGKRVSFLYCTRKKKNWWQLVDQVFIFNRIT